MANTILVLDDDPDRTAEMLEVLTANFAQYQSVFIDNAPDTITWIQHHLGETALICLDHDLGPNRERNGAVFDPGIGRDVVEYLATQEPVCPVIIHSTNLPAAFGMKARLKESGWKCSQVVPFGDLEWISEIWLSKVKMSLGARRFLGEPGV